MLCSRGRINKVKMCLDLPVEEAPSSNISSFLTVVQSTVGIEPDCNMELMRSQSRPQQRLVAVASFTLLKGKDRFNRGCCCCCCCCCCCVLIDNRRDAAASGVITDGRGCVMLVLILLLTEVGMCSRRERLHMNLFSGFRDKTGICSHRASELLGQKS
jgi:hypothetical protein